MAQMAITSMSINLWSQEEARLRGSVSLFRNKINGAGLTDIRRKIGVFYSLLVQMCKP